MRLRDRSLGAISQGLFITDPSRSDEPIVYVNAAFTQITGYAAEEALGRDIRFLRGPETDPRRLDELRRPSARGASARSRSAPTARTATPFWCALAVSPVQDPRGRVTHFVGVLTDVTGRKEGEEDLRRERGAVPLARSRPRRRSSGPRRPRASSTGDQPGWADFTGPDRRSSYEDCGWLDAVHPDDRDDDRRGLGRAAVKRRAKYESEHRLRRHDGEYRHMVARGVPDPRTPTARSASGSASTTTSPSRRGRGGAASTPRRPPRPPAGPRARSWPT